VYFRFHGSGEPGGNYSDASIARWANRLRQLAHDVKDVYSYCNNDAFGYAPVNALVLGETLRVGNRGATAAAHALI
jgi:uncharacterized protein YecE (DUF72 family)